MCKRTDIIYLLVVAIVFGGSLPPPAQAERITQKMSPAPQQRTDDEIRRVLDGLSRAVQVIGEPPTRMRFEDQLKQYRIPAVGIALIEDWRIRWVHYAGVRESGTPTPVKADTRFMVKSLSKPVAAFAALRLVEQGTLELDVPLNSQLRSWKIPTNEFTVKTEPTLRQLLAHSGGFTVFGVPSYKPGEKLPTLLQALDGTPPAKGSPVRVNYVPGTQVRYSGGGYSVLQLLLEEQAKDAFPRLMRRLVLQPAGMKQSEFYAGVPANLVPVMTVGHNGEGKPIDGKWEILVQQAAGGLISTPTDMAYFVLEVMRAWQGKSKLLSQKMAREMLTAQKENRSLGFEVNGSGETLRFSHTGSGDGFRAILVGFPARGQGAVILVNSNGGGELRYELLRSLAREYDWPDFRVVERQAITLSAEQAQVLVGSYQYTDGSATEVFEKAGRLYTRWRNLAPVEIRAASPTLFFTDTNEEFEFLMSAAKKAIELTWRGNGFAFKGVRQAGK